MFKWDDAHLGIFLVTKEAPATDEAEDPDLANGFKVKTINLWVTFEF